MPPATQNVASQTVDKEADDDDLLVVHDITHLRRQKTANIQKKVFHTLTSVTGWLLGQGARSSRGPKSEVLGTMR